MSTKRRSALNELPESVDLPCERGTLHDSNRGERHAENHQGPGQAVRALAREDARCARQQEAEASEKCQRDARQAQREKCGWARASRPSHQPVRPSPALAIRRGVYAQG